MKQRLTPQLQTVYEELQRYGGRIRRHVSPTGTLCYRLVDARRNPLRNYQKHVIDALIEISLLERDNDTGEYYLK